MREHKFRNYDVAVEILSGMGYDVINRASVVPHSIPDDYPLKDGQPVAVAILSINGLLTPNFMSSSQEIKPFQEKLRRDLEGMIGMEGQLSVR